MLKKLTNKGFSLIVLVVVLAIGAVLVTSGVLIWGRGKDQQAGSSKGAASTQTENSQKAESSRPPDATKYLPIIEWGVKLPLSKEIEGAYYTYRDGYADIFDAGFDQLKNQNGDSCGGSNVFQLYVIERIKTANLAAIEAEGGPNPRYQKFPFANEYMFGGLRAHQAPPPCAALTGSSELDLEILDMADRKKEAFEEAFEDLQPIN